MKLCFTLEKNPSFIPSYFLRIQPHFVHIHTTYMQQMLFCSVLLPKEHLDTNHPYQSLIFRFPVPTVYVIPVTLAQ